MGAQTLVVHACSGLPEMATPHLRITISSTPSLVCMYGVRPTNMLAHSPPILLVIVIIFTRSEPSLEDQEGILLALKHRDRVRHIRLTMHRRGSSRLHLSPRNLPSARMVP